MKVGSLKKFWPILIPIILSLFVFQLQFIPPELVYDFHLDQETSSDNQEYELSIQNFGVQEAFLNQQPLVSFSIGKQVFFEIEPRVLENEGMRLIGPNIKINKLEIKDGKNKVLLAISDEKLKQWSQKTEDAVIFSKEFSDMILRKVSRKPFYGVFVLLASSLLAIAYIYLPWKRRGHLFMLALFFVLSFQSLFSDKVIQFGKSYNYVSGQAEKVYLQPGEKFSQIFHSPMKGMTEMILPITIDENGTAGVWVVSSETGEVLISEMIDSQSAVKEAQLFFSKMQQKNSKDQSYEIIIKNFSSEKQKIGFDLYSKGTTLLKKKDLDDGFLGVTVKYARFSVSLWSTLVLFGFLAAYLVFFHFIPLSLSYRQKLILIYVSFFLLLCFQMKVKEYDGDAYLDPNAHLSYVASLEDTGTRLVPDYRQQWMTTSDYAADGKLLDSQGHLSGIMELSEERINYQGHPPLYHQLLRYLGGVKKTGEHKVAVDFTRILWIAEGFSLLAILACFLLGIAYLPKRLIFHWFYASSLTGFSVLVYSASQLGNDVIPLLSVSAVMFSLLQFSRQKYTFFNYCLLAIGISSAVLIKINVGIVVILLALFFLFQQLRQKNYSLIWNKAFLFSLVIYLIPLFYYIKMYMIYGQFMMSYVDIDPDSFYHSFAYIPFAQRETAYTLPEFFRHFYQLLLATWTDVRTNPMTKLIIPNTANILYQSLLVSFFALPVIFTREKETKFQILRYTSIASWFFLLNLFINTYKRYYLDGYPEGVQSRYFMFGLPTVVLFLMLCLNKNQKKYEREYTLILFFLSLILNLGWLLSAGIV